MLSIIYDQPEQRLLLDRLDYLVDGHQWDMIISSGNFLEFITNTGMNLPVPASPSWGATTTGAYRRLGTADYLISADTWAENHVRAEGDIYLELIGLREPVQTALEWPRNQPMFMSWYDFNVGNDSYLQLQCGWGDPYGNGVWLNIYSDGAADVYKDNVFLGGGNFAQGEVYYASGNDILALTPTGPRQSLANQRIDLFLIPYRSRELLVMSNQGGGFNWLFEDIPVGTPTPTITPPGRFWWYVPEGAMQVQCAPMRFGTAGYFITPPFKFRYPPQPGAVPSFNVYWDAPNIGSASVSASLKDGDIPSLPFTPDGTVNSARLQVVLTSDGQSSPWLYGCSVTYEGTVANTGGSAGTVTSYALADAPPRITCGETPDSNSFEFTFKSPAVLDGTLAPGVRTTSNRPVTAYIGTVPFFRGSTDGPEWEEAISDEARRVTQKCRDLWKPLENYRIMDPIPINGMNLGSAIKYFAKLPGFSESQMDIEYIDFTLPLLDQASKGEWTLIPEVGDTPAQWIQRLWEDFARTYFISWRPTEEGYFFQVRSPEGMGTVASKTLSPTINAAAGNPENVYRTFRNRRLEPEANDIWVTGYDPRTRKPISVHYADLDSQDPTLAPASRPDNWLGEIRRYALMDPAISDYDSAQWAAGILRKRLTPSRDMAEWKSSLLTFISNPSVPLWRGEVVELSGKGRYRIVHYEGSHPLEVGTGLRYRDYTYIGERIGD